MSTDSAETRTIGAKRWAIAEGYIPAQSTGPEPEMTSHETACILNCNREPVRVSITVYFTDRPPQGPYRFEVPAERTLHVRFNELGAGAIPRGADFASVIEADRPIVVQHTRLDSRQEANALLSTIAFHDAR